MGFASLLSSGGGCVVCNGALGLGLGLGLGLRLGLGPHWTMHSASVTVSSSYVSNMLLSQLQDIAIWQPCAMY